MTKQKGFFVMRFAGFLSLLFAGFASSLSAQTTDIIVLPDDYTVITGTATGSTTLSNLWYDDTSYITGREGVPALGMPELVVNFEATFTTPNSDPIIEFLIDTVLRANTTNLQMEVFCWNDSTSVWDCLDIVTLPFNTWQAYTWDATGFEVNTTGNEYEIDTRFEIREDGLSVVNPWNVELDLLNWRYEQ